MDQFKTRQLVANWFFVARFFYFGIMRNMTISQKLVKFLEKNKVKYEVVRHRTVFTAFDKAATLKVKPSVIGKTLVLKAGSELVVVLAPGNKNIDLAKIKKATKATKVGFISEKVMKNKFRGFKMGAIPPFGDLFKMPVFIDKRLLKEKNILVNSGVYEESIKISPKVFEKSGAIKGDFAKAR